MEKKLIDFDKVKGIRYLCSKCNKLVCEPFECLAWQGLESVPDIYEMVDKVGVVKAIEEAHNKASNCNTAFGEKGVENE